LKTSETFAIHGQIKAITFMNFGREKNSIWSNLSSQQSQAHSIIRDYVNCELSYFFGWLHV